MASKMSSLKFYLLLCLAVISVANKPELPLCPSGIQFLPQELPLHCQMPPPKDPGSMFPYPPPFPGPPFPGQPFPGSPPQFPGASFPGVPFPGQPFPGAPFPGAPFPAMPPVMMFDGTPATVKPGTVTAPPGLPMSMPLAMPMPMPMPAPAKLPVVVMPFYSRDPAFGKIRRPHRPVVANRYRNSRYRNHRYESSDTSSDTDSDTDTDTSSDTDTDTSGDRSYWRGRKRPHNRKRSGKSGKRRSKNRSYRRNIPNEGNRKELFTPVLQYVTKDGYVIYEKKITKDEAQDWLNVKTNKNEELEQKGPHPRHLQVNINEDVEVFKNMALNEGPNQPDKAKQNIRGHQHRKNHQNR